MSPKLREAQALLSDPNFDVAEFVRVINIHYQNTQIVKALGTNPDVVLGLIESDDYKFLELCPHFIDMKIFPQFKELGYEIWHRHQENKYRLDSDWWGVVINEDLTLFYRALGNKYNKKTQFTVKKGKDAATNARKRWKGVKMTQDGVKHEKLPVYQVRTDLRELGKTLGLSSGWRQNETDSEIFWRRRGHSWNKRFNMTLLQSGKEYVRASVRGEAKDMLISYENKPNGAMSWRGSAVASKKFKISEPNLPLKILEWGSQATKPNEEFMDWDPALKLKIATMKKDAGI
jgi:hypothetical protein